MPPARGAHRPARLLRLRLRLCAPAAARAGHARRPGAFQRPNTPPLTLVRAAWPPAASEINARRPASDPPPRPPSKVMRTYACAHVNLPKPPQTPGVSRLGGIGCSGALGNLRAAGKQQRRGRGFGWRNMLGHGGGKGWVESLGIRPGTLGDDREERSDTARGPGIRSLLTSSPLWRSRLNRTLGGRQRGRQWRGRGRGGWGVVRVVQGRERGRRGG